MKSIILLTTTVGTIIGGYIPSLWGADDLSLAALLLGAIGGVLGIWVGYKINQYIDN